LASTLAAAAQAREAPLPLSAFGRLPTFEDLALSADGKRIAFVGTREDQRILYVTDITTLKGAKGFRVGDEKLRDLEWQDADTLFIVVSTTSTPPVGFIGPASEWFLASRFNWKETRLRPLSFDIEHEITFNAVLGWSFREVNGMSMLYARGVVVNSGVSLFSVTPHGDAHIVARSTHSSTQWLLGPDGKIVAEMGYDDRSQAWGMRLREGSSLVSVAKGHESIDTPSVLGFSADGTAVILEKTENAKTAWYPVSLKDGVVGAALDNGNTLRSPILDPKTDRIVGGTRGVDELTYVFFDNELQAHWNAVLRAFPKEQVRLVSYSDDWNRMVVSVLGETHGYCYAIFDWYTHEAKIFGPVYKDITKPAAVKKIHYTAADGLTVPAILTLPNELEPKNLPLVVLPHGGPAATDVLGFDWWAQALANQGYVVLQPNYRGSTLSEEYLEKGYGEWGRKMQTDLSDGIAHLASEGIIDPKRVCIVGASYGGYAALAGATLQPDVYRCAVSVAGLGDLGRFRSWVKDLRSHRTLRYWDRFMGLAEHDDKSMKDISPIEHVAAVKAPVLLIHGKDDTVVPFEQSEVMEKALKKAGKQVEFVTLNHEDHWLSRSATRLQMLEATVDFLKKNNPPD
jgi:dipeptidyl aminopeptidase/acylaminoacyl peptidase